jgi:hypothetical protein
MTGPPSTHTGSRELSRFVDAVRREYRQRPPFDELSDGARLANTTRVVACQVLEELPAAQRCAIAAGLHDLDRVALLRDPDEIFQAAENPADVVFDLICEVCWQQLVEEPAIRVEDEIRSILTEVEAR